MRKPAIVRSNFNFLSTLPRWWKDERTSAIYTRNTRSHDEESLQKVILREKDKAYQDLAISEVFFKHGF